MDCGNRGGRPEATPREEPLLRLVITAGSRRGLVFPLLDRPVRIGREPDSTIQVDDKKASRNHAIIEPTTGGWVLRDLGSTNLTFLNENPVTQAVLKDGDRIRVGSTELTLCSSAVSHATASEPATALPPSTDPDVSVSMDLRSLQQSLRSSRTDGSGLQEVLYELSLRGGVAAEPAQYIDAVGGIIAQHLHAAAWAWVDWPKGPDEPFLVRGRRDGRFVDPSELNVSRTLIQRVIRERTGLLSSDLSSEFDQSLVVQQKQIGSAIAVPLYDEHHQWVLYLDRTSKTRFTRDELECLAVLGSTVALQLANMHLYRGLEAAYEQLHRSQAELVRSEKLAGIGRLASGFAHDLSTPLGSALGFLELALKVVQSAESDPSAQKVTHYLRQAMASANYGRALTRNLLAFARQKPFGGNVNTDKFLVKQVVLATAQICHSALAKNSAEVTINVADEMELEGDPSSLQQVIVNLVSNAADAMADMPETVERLVEIHAERTSTGIRLTVSDRGPGIPPDIASRIFEPLFTTKGSERGTGLGLFVVHRIVHNSGGSISFEARSGGGTTFTVDLPPRLVRLGEEDRRSSNKAGPTSLAVPECTGSP